MNDWDDQVIIIYDVIQWLDNRNKWLMLLIVVSETRQRVLVVVRRQLPRSTKRNKIDFFLFNIRI